MAFKTSEQRQVDRLEQFGEGLGELFFQLENDLYNLRLQLRIQTAFFGYDKRRIDLLNSISGATALVLQSSMSDAILLRICRLTDPPTGNRGKSKNITICRLPLYFADSEFIGELNELVESAKNSSDFARKRRHKSIAHSDEDFRSGKLKLPSFDVCSFNTAADAIAATLKFVAAKCLDVHLSTHPISEFSSDEVKFVETLYYGALSLADRKDRALKCAKEGKFDEAEDLLSGTPKWVSFRPEDVID